VAYLVLQTTPKMIGPLQAIRAFITHTKLWFYLLFVEKVVQVFMAIFTAQSSSEATQQTFFTS